MAEKNPPVWMQSGTYSAMEDRLVTGMLSSRSTDPTTGVTSPMVDGGVVGGPDQLHVTAAGGMAVSVSAGAIVVPAGTQPPGAFLCYSDGQVSLSLDIETSGNPRKDLIIAEVTDATLNPESPSAWRITYVKGNPSPSPVAPRPSNTGRYWFSIAEVTVKPASLNGGFNRIVQGDIADMRQFNTAQGGVYVKWPGGLPYPPASPGRLLYDVQGKQLKVNNGTTNGWSAVYTQEDWKSVLTMYRPRQVLSGIYLERKAKGTWTATPGRPGDGKPALEQPIELSDYKSPAGRLRISLSGVGKVDELSSAGYVSVSVHGPGGAMLEAPGYHKAIAFFSKNWMQSSNTFIVSGLDPKASYTVRCQFSRDGGDTGRAVFRNLVLVVEGLF